MSADPLADLKRLPAEAITPCAGCGKQILETGLPMFYRVTVEQCAMDMKAVRQHVGLGMMLGGGAAGMAIAGVMGAHQQPAVVLSQGVKNYCHGCVRDELLCVALADGEEADG